MTPNTKHGELIALIDSKPDGHPSEVPRMPTLERHAVFATVRQHYRVRGYRLRVKTDGAWHYVRKVPMRGDTPETDNTSPDSL